MNRNIPKEMTCWQAFSYIKPGQNFRGSLTLNKTKVVPPLKYPNQVLIKVKSAALNPIDSAQLRGYGSTAFHTASNLINNLHDPARNIISELPITPGRDFFGEVISLGQTVDKNRLKIGDLVLGSTLPFMSSLDGGSLANYLVTPDCQVLKVLDRIKEKHLDFVSIPYAGLTAWAALEDSGSIKISDNKNNQTKKQILIPGSTGLVGFIAVQLAKFSNAFTKIDTVISNNPKAELIIRQLKEAGFIDKVYTADNVKDCTDKYDLIIDCVRRTSRDDEENILKLVNENGRFVSLNSSLLKSQDQQGLLPGSVFACLDLIQRNISMNRFNPVDPGYVWGFYRPQMNRLEMLMKWYSEGEMKILPIKVMNFEEADQGLDIMDTKGEYEKIVINMES